MRKLILLAALIAVAFVVASPSDAEAHWGCRRGYYGAYYAPAYSYGYAPAYSYSYAPAYSYGYGYSPIYSYGYGYPAGGLYYSRPGFGLTVGTGYGYGGYGYYGGYGGWRHRHW